MNSTSSFYLICCLLLVSADPANAIIFNDANSEPIIQVRPSVELDEARAVTIGDITNFQGFGERELSQIKSIRLTDAPAEGEERVFSDVALSQIFRQYLPLLQAEHGEKIRMMIPSRVVVSRKVFRLNSQDVENEIRSQLQTICSACEFQFSNLTLPTLNGVMDRSTTWRVRLRSELPRGSFSVPLELKNQQGQKTLWVSGSLQIFRRVPIAQRMLQIGDKVAESDFSFERRDVTFESDAFPTQAELMSAFAARGIAVSKPIGRSMIRREQALKVGEPVRIVSGTDDWQISMDGIAQQNGFVGDLVRVQIPRTRKSLSGMVKEKGLVEVR